MKRLFSIIIICILTLTFVTVFSACNDSSSEDSAFENIINDNTFEKYEIETSSDAGVLDISDDFRFTGLNKEKTKSYFSSYNNVTTAEYGMYTCGLIPAQEMNNSVDVGDGELVYTFALDGNGIFVLLRTLSLSLEYKFLNYYGASVSVSYKIDDGSYTIIKNIIPETYDAICISETNFNDVINNLSKNSQKLYVKISLNHAAYTNVPLSHVSLMLFSVGFKGMQNFTMKQGASVKQSEYLQTDLCFRTFIAKDVYDKIVEDYNTQDYDISLGKVILPVEYIDHYNASIEKDNIDFVDGKIIVGSYTKGLNNIGYTLSPYLITINDVSYYYYDTSVKLSNKWFTKDFTGKGYIRILDKSKNEVFFTLAAYKNQDITENSRSPVFCSQKLIENDVLLADKLNYIFINNMLDEYIESKYTLRKFYVDADFNIVEVSETVYFDKINNKIVLTEDDLKSGRAGFSAAANGIITDVVNVIYRDSEYNRVYPLGKTVINRYYLADI